MAAIGYRLEMRVNGALVTTWPDIELRSGQTWSEAAPIGSGRVDVELLRLADPATVYRHVTLLLSAAAQDELGPGA